MSFKSFLTAVKGEFVNILFPNFCCGCGDPLSYDKYICDKCYEALEKVRIKKPRRRTLYGHRYRIHTIYAYEDENETSMIVKRLKFGKMFSGSRFMGKCIADKARSLRRSFDIVTYVPMYRFSESERTFNQCEYIASCVAKELNVKERDCLVKRRVTMKQHNLSSVDRQRNLKDAFKAKRCVEGKNILLVDDVTTTGTTLSECAHALYEGGAAAVTLIAFGLTKRKR